MVIEDIIAKGEDIHSEFKASFNIEAIESLVAFANTNGGAVYIGISDSGVVKGVDLSKETIVNWINDIKQKGSTAIYQPEFT